MHHETEALFGRGTDTHARSARWLILLRLVVLLLSVSVMFMVSAADNPFAPALVYTILLGLSAINLTYLALLRLIRLRTERFLEFQTLVDMCAVTMLVFLTGGPASPFVYLFFFSIMGAGIVLSNRSNTFFACMAVALLSGVVILHKLGIGRELILREFLPAEDIVPQAGRLLLIAAGFFMVSFLCGLLRARLAISRIVNEEILQNMPEGVAVFDTENRALYINSEFRRLFGIPAEARSTGLSVDELLPDPGLSVIAEAVEGGSAEPFELPELPDRRPPLEVRTTPIGPESNRRGTIVLFIDLSLRNRLENAERRAERYEAVSEMAAGLAHEIRNPLTSVRGSIQELSGEFGPNTTQRMLCDIVIKESDRLDQIITEFLQFARQRPMRLASVRFDVLLNEIRCLLSARPDAANVLLDLSVAGDVCVRADVEQMRELCLNIGVNAINAMDGSGRLTIAATAIPRPKRGSVSDIERPMGVLVTFSDTGPGLHPGQEDLIFEPFYTTKPRGTGLGLAIARKAVQSHDGDIWAENNPKGGGSTFSFWIPRNGPNATERRLTEGTGMFHKRRRNP